MNSKFISADVSNDVIPKITIRVKAFVKISAIKNPKAKSIKRNER